ncbi:hypothetical protein DL768_008397 [Monosporascus sp. mg162]|nr:hypothetical protein DL768_008397 [Monosporascus sp. mg162]
MTHSVPLKKRPLFTALTGGTYGVAAIAGPPLGEPSLTDCGSVIALFTVSGVLFVSFIVIQWWAQDNATVPPRIFKNRTIWSCALYQFTLRAGFFVFIYFVPLWFQAVQGVTAIESGTRNLPMLIGNMIGTTIAGILVTVIGYYAPFMYIVATAILFFTQTVGESIFVSVAQAAFSNELVQELSTRAPGLDLEIVLDRGAGDLANLVPKQYLPEVIMSYNNGLANSFVVGTVMVAASILGCVFVEWNSVKGMKRDVIVAA